MRDNLEIEKLFKDKFESFEPAVDAKVWQGIASNVGAASSTAAASGVTWLKGLLIGAVATTVGIGAWVYFQEDTVPSQQTLVVETPVVKELEQTDLLNETASSDDNALVISAEELEYANTVDALNNLNTKNAPSAPLQQKVIQPSIDPPTASDGGSPISTARRSAGVNNGTEHEMNLTDDNSMGSNGSRSENTSDVDVASKTTAASISPATDNVIIDMSADDNALPVQETKTEDKNASFLVDIPNVFTPSNDGTNDMFYIPEEKMQNIESFYILIRSKNNIKLFESNDPNFKWDGYDLGDIKVPKGEYYYLIKAIGSDDKPYSIAGKINIF